MRLILLATMFMWTVIFSLIGCAPRAFKIGNGLQVESIKIEPSKGPKSVYRAERYI